MDDRLFQLRTMPYEEYLKTPEWAEKRKQALERDNYRCRTCNSAEHLHVHHRTYARRGNEDRGDLTTLCKSCHEHFHEKIDQESLMERTYEKPYVPKSKDERSIQWEEYLVGLLLHSPHVCFQVHRILEGYGFVGKDVGRLYQILCQEQVIPSDLQSLTARIRKETTVPPDIDVKNGAIQTATRIKRRSLLQQHTDLMYQLQAARETNDEEVLQRLHLQVQFIHAQIRTIDAALHLR